MLKFLSLETTETGGATRNYTTIAVLSVSAGVWLVKYLLARRKQGNSRGGVISTFRQEIKANSVFNMETAKSKSKGKIKDTPPQTQPKADAGVPQVQIEIPPPPQSPKPEKSNMPNNKDNKDQDTELLLLGSREAERNLLILLNQRLEKVIGRNRQLQHDNNQLVSQLDVAKVQATARVTEVTVKANEEMEKLREELANAKKEVTVLTFKMATAKKEANDATKKMENAVKEKDAQNNKVAELEKKVNDLQNQLKKDQGEKQRLEREHDEWKDEAIKMGEVLQETKIELEKEILAKLDLEKQLKGRLDEATLKTTVVQAEMVQMKASTGQLLHDQNEQQKKEFERILEKSMTKLRNEYNKKLIENKEEQAKLYKAREQDHIAQKAALAEKLKNKEEELEKAKKEAKDLTETIRRLETERHALLVQLDDLEQERKAERAKLEKEIENRDKLIEIKTKEHNDLLNRCQHLLDIKVALDNELAAYKMLLEAEESRLEMGESGKEKKDENQNIKKQQNGEVGKASA